MKQPFQIGDKKQFLKVVSNQDTATFEAGMVHPVYATFAIGRDAEWVCRLFVLDMKEMHEEGIGTYLTIFHHAPALIGTEINYVATLKAVNRNEVICTFEAHAGERLIATGETGQKILEKQKLEERFNRLTAGITQHDGD